MLKCGAVSARNFNKFKFNRLYLFEERDCFISGEHVVGCVKERNFILPTPRSTKLHGCTMTVVPELKHYIEDLLPDTLDRNGFQLLIRGRPISKGLFMYPDGRHLTAFVNPSGLYEWIRIQTRLKNTPGEFQRSMEEDRLRDFRDDFCEPYLDDVIVYSKSFKELVEHVRQVLRRLRENGIKLRANMCNLFQKRCVNAKAMEEFRTHEPQNVADVRKLPGLFGYYCRYLESFSRIANLLQISAISTKSDMSHSSQQNENNKKNSGFIQNSSYVGRKT